MNFRLGANTAKDNFPKLGGDVNNDSKAILSLRTGKCTLAELADGKYNVTPDKNCRGNLIFIKGNDGKHHLQWFNLSNKSLLPEMDHIVYNGIATMKKAKIVREDIDIEATDKDRVLVIKLTKEDSASEFLMFWVQDKAKTNDDIEQMINTFNNTVKNLSNTRPNDISAATPTIDFSSLLSSVKAPDSSVPSSSASSDNK